MDHEGTSMSGEVCPPPHNFDPGERIDERPDLVEVVGHPPLVGLCWATHRFTLGSGMAHLILLGTMCAIPPDPKSLALDLLRGDIRSVHFLVSPTVASARPEGSPKGSSRASGPPGRASDGPPGQMGTQRASARAGSYRLQGPRDNPSPAIARALAEQFAAHAGILGSLERTEGSHIGSLFGRESALGKDPETVLGGLTGTQAGEAFGTFGLAPAGPGHGGGGDGHGTLGLGHLDTLGRWGGQKPGGVPYGEGGVATLRTRRAGAPPGLVGQPAVRGALDREIIRRVVRRHVSEVRFCYEKEALGRKGLRGRVVVQFTISPMGQTSAASIVESTTQDDALDDCIAQAVRRWDYPKPQGGGIVVVSYPFVLEMAGGSGSSP